MYLYSLFLFVLGFCLYNTDMWGFLNTSVLVIGIALLISLTVNYDPYPVDKNFLDFYLKSSAKSKMDFAWDKIQNSVGHGDFVLPMWVFVVPMKPTFDHPGDFFPTGRKRYIHGIGTTAQVSFVPLRAQNTPRYTGIFEGATQGVLRMSAVLEPDATAGVGPGLGLKFFRDGMDSANLVALDGSERAPPDALGLFTTTLYTTILPAKGLVPKVLEGKFGTLDRYIHPIGLSNLASHREDGTPSADIKFPFMLKFEPTPQVVEATNVKYDNFDHALDVASKRIEVGVNVMAVHALNKPKELGGEWNLIGHLVTNSRFTTSTWSDENLFFRHQSIHADLALEPEWVPFTHSLDSKTCPISR
eukprot:m.142963 g.142963  ORF g.142963 m.142963 type:complete len:359 (+) comp30283_c0_seq1:485-1561(+)